MRDWRGLLQAHTTREVDPHMAGWGPPGLWESQTQILSASLDNDGLPAYAGESRQFSGH